MNVVQFVYLLFLVNSEDRCADCTTLLNGSFWAVHCINHRLALSVTGEPVNSEFAQPHNFARLLPLKSCGAF